MYRGHRPFRELDRIVGNTSTVFQEWLKHPEVDAYLEQLEITPEQYRRIDVPILTITGSYDDDQPGAMTYYRSHQKHGTAEARARHFLIMGPWDHAGTRTPSKEVGGLVFGDNCLLDLNALHTEWYDWTMKGGSEARVPEPARGLLRDGRRPVEARRLPGGGHPANADALPRFGRGPGPTTSSPPAA